MWWRHENRNGAPCWADGDRTERLPVERRDLDVSQHGPRQGRGGGGGGGGMWSLCAVK